MKNSPSSSSFSSLLKCVQNSPFTFTHNQKTLSSIFLWEVGPRKWKWICIVCWVSKLRADFSWRVENVSASVWVRANLPTFDPSLTVPSVSSRRHHSGRPHHGLNARWGRNLLPCLLFSSFIHPPLLLWSPHLSVFLVSFFFYAVLSLDVPPVSHFPHLSPLNFKVELKLYKRMYK